MANNPLFSCITGKTGKRFTYNLESSRDSPLPGSYRPLQSSNVNMQGSNNQSPRAKRRKTEEKEEEEEEKWDDDFMLTQENIAELDEMARAAITGQTKHRGTDPGPSTTPLSRQTFPKAPSAPTFMHKTSTPSGRVTFKPPMGPGVSNISLPHHSDSSSSKNTNSSRNSSTTPYPGSLSSGRRSTSLSSHDNSSKSAGSVEIPFQPPNRKPNLSSSSSSSVSSESLGMKSPISEGIREELENYKQQCDLLKVEMESIKQELYVKEGENKILREKLETKEAELSASKQQKLKLTEQQMKEQSQRERQLKAEIQSLNTQLQFKERDLAELREKCRDLETSVSAAGDSQIPSTSSAHHSPRVRKVVVSPKGKRSGFPSTKSFLVEEGSQLVQPAQSKKDDVEMKDAAITADIKEETEKKGRNRRFQLKVEPSKGTVTGNHFLSKLSEVSLQGLPGPGSIPDRGLMGLLQMNPPSMDLQSFLFDRDSTKLLSPIPTKRMSDKKPAIDRPKLRPIVSTNSYSRAMEGIHSILSGSNQSPLISLLDLSHANISSEQSASSLQPQGLSSESQSALLFLPLLNDYLSNYIEMMNCYVERGQTLLSPQSSSSSSFGPSSSSDSTMDSLSSSLNTLLRDGAAYANSLESQALSALTVLYKLVLYCDAVRDILLCSDDVLSDSSVSSFEKVVEEEMDQDNPPSSLSSISSSQSSTNSVRQSVLDCHMLGKIIRLANPGKASSEGEEPRKYNEWVVHKALSIIRVLSENCRDDQLARILPVIGKGVLSNCLKCSSTPAVVLGGLDTMCSLNKHEKAVLMACSCPNQCVLLPLYQLCSSPVALFSDEILVEFAAKTLRCLSSVGSHNKEGMNLLLDTQCKSQLQKSTVLLLHKILLQYQLNQSSEAKRVLQKGTLFLHNLSQVDGQFEEHHYVVQHQYVELICGLNTLFKPAEYENERCAIAELWYFGREDSDSSQDDDDDEMEIS
ncbi:ATR-interacting protein-like [Saccostrea echinata]|uniref:ATR-interacting protein-like n=1 Tax=Saccostrea echinata TaxID=191078 RepID=UPI002A811F19|nr:ATR-interacting protein-like [Saccostrea echinata]